MVKQLPPDDRQIIEEVYFKNRPIANVGADLGISKSWASRLHARAIKHLRELMEQHGLLSSS
jgi:RNA polymerase sigma factor for flagellar operon FliA